MATIDTIYPTVVPRTGGFKITLTGDFSGGSLYNVFIIDPVTGDGVKAYAGIGKGAKATPKGGTSLVFYTPEMPTVELYHIYVVDTEDAGNNATANNSLMLVDRDYGTSYWQMKRHFAPNRALGLREMIDLPEPVRPQNLLLHSGDLTDGAWVATGVVVTDTAEDPFGGTLGFLFTENIGNSEHQITQTLVPEAIVGAAYTAAIYVKKQDRLYVSIDGEAGGYTFGQVFDLTFFVPSAATDTGGIILSATVKPVDLAEDWYRIEVTFRAVDTDPIVIRYSIRSGDDTNTFVGSGNPAAIFAFPSLDQYPFARTYRETEGVALT